ncbi:MAG: InlB B-repeat-containing protein, partial [Prevotellaceae bacterium]|nr:InlB B-repeat-containing protein [Prevotellaceae bacterium]
ASVRSWDKSSNSTLYAHWKVRAYKVIYHSNDTRNIVEEKNATLSNYQVEYSSAQGWIAGYTFKGWSYSTNGSVDLQQGNNISPDNVNINEETKELHLYAVWQANEYALTLDPQGGTGGTTTVTASFGQSMPEIQIPARAGYTFNGYWDSSSNKYYDVDGSSARNWDKSENATLYAHWTPIKYVLTLNAGPNTVIPTTDFGNGTHSYIVSEDRTTITMDVSLEENLGSFYNGVPKKPGFKFVGFYVDDILVASATGDKGRNLEFTNNAYINNSVWKYTGNLTLTARWIPKYTLSDNVLTFNDGEYLEVGIDWQSGKVNDLLGATEYEVQQGHISSDNPVMAFDIRNVIYQDGSSNNAYNLMQGLQNKNYISPNALVYVGSDAYSEYKVNNVIRPLGQGDEAKFNNIVVTDRYPIKIIESFTAQTATYERNKAQKGDENDAMWQQSKESVWGTLCLPYPIKNNQSYTDDNGIKYEISFYELRNTYTNNQGQSYMQFYEMNNANQVIQANTPVLYCRTKGVGSAVTVQESNVIIPANADYKTTVINYSNKDQVPLAEESIMYWKFVGTLEEKTFIGSEYRKPENYGPTASPGAIEVKDRDIYYFASNKFTHMNSLKGKVVVLPYRAYFEDYTDFYANSKVSSYSILVVDADGTTTDITNLIDNHEAKGNGKIYDLSGRRVKQPVKGSIYIVDGKKKMY